MRKMSSNKITKKILQLMFFFIGMIIFLPVSGQVNAYPEPSNFNKFSLDFYNKISDAPQNLVTSPYSLASVLALLAAGAHGDTRQQLLTALQLSDNKNNLIDSLALATNQQLIIANALWAQKNLSYQKDFLRLLNNQDNINFYRLDFSDSAKATQVINNWIEKKTNGKITKLIPAGAIDKMTRLVLTNAIYFKGNWLHPFPLAQTKPLPFTLPNGKKINVDTMQQQHQFLYGDNEIFQVISLPYDNKQLAMLIILPRFHATLQDAKQELTQAGFARLSSALNPIEVTVFLPKFKIYSTLDNLNGALQMMGITDAFSSKADFSGMVKQPLYISMIIQKAMIDVDEKGTTAAAATAAIMRTTAVLNPTLPIIFRADHPFLFAIYDIKTKNILFMGQVINPQEK